MKRYMPFVFILFFAAVAPFSWAAFFDGYGIGELIDISNLSLVNDGSDDGLAATSVMYFTGDIMLGRKVERLTNANGDDYPFRHLDIPQENAFMVGNFEAVIPKVHVPTKDFHYAFSVPTSSVPALADFGFTHLGLANNHSYDFGSDDYLNTREVITNNGMVPFGDQLERATTSFSILDMADTRVALIGVYAVEDYPDMASLEDIFGELTDDTDLQVAYVHWGTEYRLTHSDFQADLATKLVNMGADLVVGHHPHVVQDVDVVDDVLVFYSLGNLIFDQYFSDDVQQGLILKLNTSLKPASIDLLPVSSQKVQSSPYLMDVVDKKVFLDKLSDRSSTELQDEIRSGKIYLR